MSHPVPRRSPGARRTIAAVAAATVALPLSFAALASATAAPQPPGSEPDPVAEEDFSVLVFSKTAGFRHSSIPAGIAAIEQLGEENDFAVDATENAEEFTEENLANYDAVVWLSTTGDVLNDEQQAAFESYIQGGGGYAGIHAASDTEYDWPWYGELVGAYFAGHPQNQTATILVEDHDHPSTAHLDEEWERFDEWYNFQSNPRGQVHVLATLDESTYDAGSSAMGEDHPIAWCHPFDGGRSWYTGGGHTEESFAEPEFLQHVLGGIQSVAGAVESDCSTTPSEGFVDVTPETKFAAEIGWLAERGIARGWELPDGTREFRPVTPVARDAMAAFLYRLADEPEFEAPDVSPFTDVSTDNQFYEEIAWLHAEEISTGWANGDGTYSFRPLEPIARDAMAAFLYRYSDVDPAAEPAPAASPFDDVSTANQYFAEIAWLAESGVATGWVGEGNDGTTIFRPLSPVNRDAMAAFMFRLENGA
ncbi:ThuA domain-containing protein [Litorihabitans aurantiacus]|uniref:SLH domain-containing protein n=1 Tax=Litorihabitans aurantiacus TaxID=1930061 RepID=A0AA38CU89_9MICO|nr:ThuA domain-containing protein [Litorihabitans aurantiacus]GMA33221.1 hypothetical protein GCM10025875_32130 [Litorihabitans aurantiacus]